MSETKWDESEQKKWVEHVRNFKPTVNASTFDEED